MLLAPSVPGEAPRGLDYTGDPRLQGIWTLLRVPTITLPTHGADESVFRANEWMVRQVLATGVHGILLCHAESPAAVQAFVDATRFPFVAGGIGRPYATLGGAVIVGLVLQIAGTYTSSAYELVFAFLFLVVLMLFRPNGVFVRQSAVAVRA